MNLKRVFIKENSIIDLLDLKHSFSCQKSFDGISLFVDRDLKNFSGIIARVLEDGSQSFNPHDGGDPLLTHFSFKDRDSALESIRFISYFTGLPVKEILK